MASFFNLFTPRITKGDNMTPEERAALRARGNTIAPGDLLGTMAPPPPPPPSAPAAASAATSSALAAAARARKRAAAGSTLATGGGPTGPRAVLQPKTLLGY